MHRHPLCRLLLASTMSLMMVLASAGAELAAPPARPIDPETLHEIQRQRARFESPLAGSSFGDPAATEANSAVFAESLQRIANERRGESALNEDPRGNLPTPDPRTRYVTALREAARLLETAAADLEDAESYAEADELRARAGKLRQEARGALQFSRNYKPAE